MMFAIGPSLNNAEPMLMPASIVASVIIIKNGQLIPLILLLNLRIQHLQQHLFLCAGKSSSISDNSEDSDSDELELESSVEFSIAAAKATAAAAIDFAALAAATDFAASATGI
jgi:hypothetical protein